MMRTLCFFVAATWLLVSASEDETHKDHNSKVIKELNKSGLETTSDEFGDFYGSAISTGLTKEASAVILDSPESQEGSTNLRGSSTGIDVVAEHAELPKDDADDHERHLQSSYTLKLVNTCGYALSLGLIWQSGPSLYFLPSWPLLNPGDSITKTGVTGSTFYIKGTRQDNNEALWVASAGDYCFQGPGCYTAVNMGGTSSERVKPLCMNSAPDPIPEPGPGVEGIDAEWLEGHNRRRTLFYSENGLGPMNLKWSEDIARSAANYANMLTELSGCSIQHGYKGDDYGGENLAANWGSGYYNRPRTPEEILKAFTEDELLLPNLEDKYHATQVLFRSSHYVGCGQAQKDMGGGWGCHIQVCRYIAAGNCFSRDQTKWMQEVLSDTQAQRCGGPQCPAEGCF